MKPLAKIISDEINQKGVISFARFMELALYCPNCGYYEQERDIGKHGDFFTSVSVGNVFGELLGFQFSKWFDGFNSVVPQTKVESVDSWKIVETGAHDGKLALDILNWINVWRSQQFEKIQYWIIEPSLSRRQWQRKTLQEFKTKIRWASSLCEIVAQAKTINGIIFSNEFFDALPVHRFSWDSQKLEWFEWGVAIVGGEFTWARMPSAKCAQISFCYQKNKIANAPLREHFDFLPDGFSIEVCPEATKWWRGAANALGVGKLLTIDYGLTEEEIISPERSAGTLRAYHKHRLNQNILVNIGEQDITAHVNFSALQIAGEESGLKTEALIAQEKFLMEIVAKISTEPAEFADWTSARVRQLQTLSHPEHLGRHFRVLIQSRK